MIVLQISLTSEKDHLDLQQMQLSTDKLRETKTTFYLLIILYHLQPTYNRYTNYIYSHKLINFSLLYHCLSIFLFHTQEYTPTFVQI